MKKYILGISLLIIYSISSAGDFSSYRNAYETNTVVSAVEIKDKGLYNLIIGIDYTGKPDDSKVYKGDLYENFLKKLLIEIKGVASQTILENNSVTLAGLSELRKKVEANIKAKVNTMKDLHFKDQKIDFPWSITNFYLLKPEACK